MVISLLILFTSNFGFAQIGKNTDVSLPIGYSDYED